jgi:hypothetical protein
LCSTGINGIQGGWKDWKIRRESDVLVEMISGGGKAYFIK